MNVLAVCLICLFFPCHRRLKSEKLCHICHNRVKICLFFFIRSYIIRVKFRIGNFLIWNVGKEGIVISSCKSNCQASCFVISCHKDQCLIRVLVIKLHCFSYSLIHGHSVCNGCRRIICMTGPVNLSALAHHKKSCFVIENLDSFFNIVCKSPFALFAIHIIAHCIVISKGLINNDCFSVLCCEIFCLCLGFHHLVSGLLSQLIQIFFISVGSSCFFQSASCKIIKFTGDHLFADFIIVISGILVCIKSRRCSMI